MKPDIVDKVRNELSEPICSERQVVYLLAELRKLMELESIERVEAGGPADASYFALKFYCDWAVHVRLDQSGAQRIVQRFNRYQQFMEELASPGEDRVTVDPAFLEELDQSLQLTKFREQLGAYLHSHDLGSEIATNEKLWVTFLTYYSHVIEDAPLISEVKGLEWVDSVAVKVLDEQPAGAADHRLALRWTWLSKKDGMRKNTVRFF
jgi:hypothetical protein